MLRKKDRQRSINILEAPMMKEGGLVVDYWNMALLVLLYTLQGIPLGLTFGSIPFILKSQTSSYAEIGLFSLASYPYSLKLFWSPIVDSLYFKDFGRRKSWIVPIQTILGLLLFWIGSNIEDLLKGPHLPIEFLSVLFFILIFFTATQDIAVDGWAITILSEENKGYASTCQTIGLNTGHFISFTIFLALSSSDFSNYYVRYYLGYEQLPEGLIGLGNFIKFWSLVYLVTTTLLVLFVKEDPEIEEPASIRTVYHQIWQIIQLPNMRKLIVLLLICKIGFMANESVTALKLLDKGFKKEDLALTVLLDFPLQILIGYYGAKYARGKEPLKPWLYAFQLRLFFALFGMGVVYIFPNGGEISTSYFLLVIFSSFLTSCSMTVMFVAAGAFFAVISDPKIGGTYMTLIFTISNFGGTWPQIFIYEAIDATTQTGCVLKDTNVTEFRPCVSEEEKSTCLKLGGNCEIVGIDGYYLVGFGCFLIGLFSYMFFIRKEAMRLQRLQPADWWVKRENND